MIGQKEILRNLRKLRNCAKGIKKITLIETDSTDWRLILISYSLFLISPLPL